VVEHGVVVAEPHVVGAHGPALVLLAEDVAPLEHVGDEHRAVALGGGREEVQVLPDGPAHRARDADEVLDPAPPALDRVEDEVLDDRAALGGQQARVALRARGAEAEVVGAVADHQAPVAAVADEDVGAEAEEEVGHPQLAGGEHRGRQLVGRAGGVERVGRTPDAERRVLGERDAPPHAPGPQPGVEGGERLGGERGVGGGLLVRHAR
jgi:hypothetical protein